MTVQIIYALAALGSVVGTVLAWYAKLRWSEEFASAKNETIRAKDAQIEALRTQLENLRELSPMKLREYFRSVKEQLEEQVDYTNALLKQAKMEVEENDQRIVQLNTQGQHQSQELVRLESEKSVLTKQIADLELEFPLISPNFEAYAGAAEAVASTTATLINSLSAPPKWDSVPRHSVRGALRGTLTIGEVEVPLPLSTAAKKKSGELGEE